MTKENTMSTSPAPSNAAIESDLASAQDDRQDRDAKLNGCDPDLDGEEERAHEPDVDENQMNSADADQRAATAGTLHRDVDDRRGQAEADAR